MGFLGGPDPMNRLRIGEERAKGPIEDILGEEEAMNVSPGGHIVKRRAKSRPVSWELKHRSSCTSQVSFKFASPLFSRVGVQITATLRNR